MVSNEGITNKLGLKRTMWIMCGRGLLERIGMR